MVICIKCGKEQARRSGSECEYDGHKKAGKEHSWEDRGEFIEELCEKLPPFIRERIATLQTQDTDNYLKFSERMEPLNKRHHELQTKYDYYLSEGLPRDVEKKKQEAINQAESYEREQSRIVKQKKQEAISEAETNESEQTHDFEKEKRRAKRLLLRNVIGTAIGFFIAFKLIFPIFGLDREIMTSLYFILPMAIIVLFLVGKWVVVDFLKAIRENENYFAALHNEQVEKIANAKREIENSLAALRNECMEKIMNAKRYAESQEFADKLAHVWRNGNGFDELKNKIKDEKHKWVTVHGDFEQRINSANRALAGTDEDLLYFYNKDNKTKNWYIDTFYGGAF